MAGVDTVVRLIAATLGITVVIVVAFFGVQVIDPVYNNLGFGDLPAGWGAPQETTYLFFTLAIIGLLAVIMIWWLVAPVRDDIRQETQRRPPF